MSLPILYANTFDLYNGGKIEGNTGSIEFTSNDNVNLKIKNDGNVYMPNIPEYSSTGATGSTGIVLFDIASGQLSYTSDLSVINGPTGPTGPVSGIVQTVTSEPTGHENINYSTISFDHTSRVFSIGPTGTSYNVWVGGTQYTKSSTLTTTIPNTSGLYYIFFGMTGALGYQTDYFIWNEEAPTAYIYYNSAHPEEYMLFDERHGITMDWATHEYLHRTRGAQIANGFSTYGFTTTGDGSLNSDAQFSIQNGTFFDEDLQIDITNSATPTPNTWQQQIQSPCTLPTVYLNGDAWRKTGATGFALYNAPAGRPYINTITGSTGAITECPNNSYIVSWITATNMLNTPVISIMGQDNYNNIALAENATWDELYLTGFPIVEFRPLAKIIFESNNTYTNSVKARVAGVQDLRGINQLSSQPVYSGLVGPTGPQGATGPTGYVGPAGVDTTIQYNNNGILAGDTGMTFNNTTKTLSVDNILSNVSNIITTTYGIAINTTVTLDNISARITTGGIPQVQAVSGSFTSNYSGVVIKNASFSGYTVASGTIDNTSWTNISSPSTLSNGGDTIIVNLQNKSASKIYRITYYQTSNPPETEAYAISIERII